MRNVRGKLEIPMPAALHCKTANGMNSLSHCNSVHKFIPMPRAFKKKQMRRLQWKNKWKSLRNTGMAVDESQKQN